MVISLTSFPLDNFILSTDTKIIFVLLKESLLHKNRVWSLAAGEVLSGSLVTGTGVFVLNGNGSRDISL